MNMTMRTALVLGALVMAAVLTRPAGQVAAAQSAPPMRVPAFEVDPAFPKLPNNWVMYMASVAVDRHDNVWLLHRRTPCLLAGARSRSEFDKNGRELQAWGGVGRDTSGRQRARDHRRLQRQRVDWRRQPHLGIVDVPIGRHALEVHQQGQVHHADREA